MNRVTITAVAVLVIAGLAAARVAGPDQMIKGISFARPPSGVHYDTPEADSSLARLKVSTNANWVTITPIWWQQDTGSSRVYFWPDSSPRDSELRHAIKVAHDSGLRVFLKPEVRCSSRVWIGRHDPRSPSWFEHYRTFITRYARLAQEETCELFSLGYALDSAADEAWEFTQWESIIDTVRKLYSGKLTYAADWRTYRSIGFWSLLDYIGINAYFPLCADAQPNPEPDSMTYYSGIWERLWIPQIEALLESLTVASLPVIFTEIGYRSILGCAQQPWNDTISGIYDAWEQRCCYMAALHSLLGEPWFAGWFWREWITSNYQTEVDRSYSPRGKLAQEVLRRWYASICSHAGVNLVTYKDRYGSEAAEQALDSLVAHHAQAVAIVPYWYMDSNGAGYDTIAPDPGPWPPPSPNDDSIRQAIAAAHERGLRVLLKPHVNCRNGDFRGEHDPLGAGVLDEWFDDYEVFISHYAAMAEQESCEMFAVGVEIDRAKDSPAEQAKWCNQILPAVRRRYSGPVTYAALCEGGGASRTFWRALDFAGMDAYFILYSSLHYAEQGWTIEETLPSQDPSVEDLLELTSDSWRKKWVPRLSVFCDSVERPLLFPELGYRSIDSAAWIGGRCYHYGWVRQISNTFADLHSVCFPVDTLTGYAVGTGGHVLKTTDGGKTWDPPSDAWIPETLYCVHFPTSTTFGFICGKTDGDTAALLYTTDGGKTWQKPEIRHAADPLPALYSVCFAVDSTVGIAVGDGGLILRTTDCGLTWDTTRSSTNADLRSVHFPSPDTGYAVGTRGTILKTTDNGASWVRLGAVTTVNLNSVSFASPESGLVVGDSNLVLSTTDGGRTWAVEVYPMTDGIRNFYSVSVPQYSDGRFIAGQWGTILRWGKDWPLSGSWQPTSIWPHSLRCIQIRLVSFGAGRKELVGFAVGDSGIILKTSHGGRMVIDFNEQANCYEAAFRAFWDSIADPTPLPWFYGFYWWDWSCDPQPKQEYEGWLDAFIPQQKPAGEVLREWYRAMKQGD